MKIIITGSLGHISKPLAKELVQKGHAVTVISSNSDKQKDIEAIGAAAAMASIEDGSPLAKTFTPADAVYSMLPRIKRQQRTSAGKKIGESPPVFSTITAKVAFKNRFAAWLSVFEMLKQRECKPQKRGCHGGRMVQLNMKYIGIQVI